MEFRVIDGYPYEIFENGTIFRRERKSRNGRRTLSRLQIYPSKAINGYLIVKLYYPKEDCYRKYYLHRLVYMAFHGEIADKMEIDHIDGNRHNCVLSNLQLVTHKQNCSNEVSMERYKRANALSAGKFNRDKMIAAKGKRNHDRLVRTYKRLVKKYGHCGIWMLMKAGHCGYPRAKGIIAEMTARIEAKQ